MIPLGASTKGIVRSEKWLLAKDEGKRERNGKGSLGNRTQKQPQEGSFVSSYHPEAKRFFVRQVITISSKTVL